VSAIETEVLIQAPQDLVQILQEVRRALAEGTLKQIKPADAPEAMEDISTIDDAGPWPDYIEAYFENQKTGARFKLSAETFHGAGGKWQPL